MKVFSPETRSPAVARRLRREFLARVTAACPAVTRWFPSSRRTEEFRYPIQPAPKVLVLVEGFRSHRNVRVQPAAALEKLPRLAPKYALAAPLAALRALALQGEPHQFPIVVFTGPRHGWLSGQDRDLIWNAFGVPLFEQLLGPDGGVIAEECQAHDGLHLREPVRGTAPVESTLIAAGLGVRIEQRACDCGRPGPRLLAAAPVLAPRTASAEG